MTLLDHLTAHTEEMTRATLELCQVESPSHDVGRLAEVAEHAADLGTSLLGRTPQWISEQDRPALYWEPLQGGVLLLGHLDTVWPAGTLARWPKPLRTSTTLSCPGVFDMKAGIVQGLYAMAALSAPPGCGMLLTTDEEIGSPTSRPLIEKAAARAGAVLVLEASADGAGTCRPSTRRGLLRLRRPHRHPHPRDRRHHGQHRARQSPLPCRRTCHHAC
ncbi:hypothetical protein CLM62_40615 [Streptomyces sp. SA15]|nr:M20/M25/M40 family metallo-hydrolase [Streptomyces sp. SA15]PAZ10472.1 hypothetical protein CLM62_40615 [Streptomyces sp. SA15]